ncbi:class I SAM-dependent methyltransferase [Gordonia neofelifaecis]|uniref:Methyltransferase n=1 Tax=Gordonia neofelifaecis NRRL B-59395 TaxID=644548 RepID=F1YEC9_9ACTN|nr:class I SAM-dependent methyltransferase [Gordonia neofelifaecis]EGD56762.1 methyltransferase [Gordonia neofelifaecis NRRL B-59395]
MNSISRPDDDTAADAHGGHDYLPGFGRDALLPLYDPLTRLAGIRRMHRLLVDRLALRTDDRVLDIGTGTGELALRIAVEHPDVHVIGVDPDPLALRRARRKAHRRGAGDSTRFDLGYGDRLDYADGSFDCVVSAFAYHHLPPEAQHALLDGALRVLKPGGTLDVVDFGGHVDPSDGRVARHALTNRHLATSLRDAVPVAMRAAGFETAAEIDHRVSRRIGRVTLWRATAPA